MGKRAYVLSCCVSAFGETFAQNYYYFQFQIHFIYVLELRLYYIGFHNIVIKMIRTLSVIIFLKNVYNYYNYMDIRNNNTYRYCIHDHFI